MPGIVALRKQYGELPEEVRTYFWKLESLLKDAELEIALAYLFMRLEQGRYRTVKCILVRMMRCSAKLVDNSFKDFTFQRATFRKLVKELIDIDIEQDPYKVLSAAEAVRDGLIHGRTPKPEQLREALSNGFLFVKEFGEVVKSKTGKNPFGDLRGLSSTTKMHPDSHARWIIKGVKASADPKQG